MADESILSPIESPNDSFIPVNESNLPLLPKSGIQFYDLIR